MNNDAGGASASNDVLGATHPKRDNLALWGNLVIAHVWFAAGWVRGGFWPFAVGAISLLVAGLILYEEKLSKALTTKTSGRSA